ncbi:MAG: class I SAM-dependent DNA methyltransferase [Acidimicrobiales bacterium]
MTNGDVAGDGRRDVQVRDVYDALAPVWSEATDDNLWNEVLDRRPIRSLLPAQLTGLNVLDAGMASGTMAHWLLGRGAEVTGIDISPRMVATARRRCEGQGRFFVADLAQPLELRDAAFDGVVASLVLHYLRDWPAALASLARVLRPGGWLVVSLEHPEAPFSVEHRSSYFTTEVLTDRWTKAGVTVDVSWWRRPLSAVVNDFADAGFVLDRLLEPRLSGQDRARFPSDAAGVRDGPLGAVYRWRKLPVG